MIYIDSKKDLKSNNPKLLNPGNQSHHRWNKKWQRSILDSLKYCIKDVIIYIDSKKDLKLNNPKLPNPGNQSQQRWKKEMAIKYPRLPKILNHRFIHIYRFK